MNFLKINKKAGHVKDWLKHNRMTQLMDLWRNIALYLDIKDLGAMEISSLRFFTLYAAEGYRARRYDESVSYLTYKTQYGKNGLPLTDKQVCVNLVKEGSSFAVVGGGYGSEEKPDYVIDMQYDDALLIGDNEATLANVIKHKQTFPQREEPIGCSAAVHHAFGCGTCDHGLHLFGGFLEGWERATECVLQGAIGASCKVLVPLPKNCRMLLPLP